MLRISLLSIIIITSTTVSACSDWILSKTFGEITVRYTCHCPAYICDKKLKKVFDILEKTQSNCSQPTLILINRTTELNENGSFISIASDTLREFDSSLHRDFISYNNKKSLWGKKEDYNRVSILKTIQYPMNVNISSIDSTSILGLKIIYNYPWGEPVDEQLDIIHSKNIIGLLEWGLTNRKELEQKQTTYISEGPVKGWGLSVITLPRNNIDKILNPRESVFNKWSVGIMVLILLVIMKFLFSNNAKSRERIN